MKHVLLAFFLLSVFASKSQKKTVYVSIQYLQPYCGGARPSDEMINEAERPRPYANMTVMWVSANGRIDSAKTNEQGQLKLKLKKGTYFLYESWRYYLNTPNDLPIESFDKECLKTEWQKAICKIKVQKKSADISGLGPLVKPCSWALPCLNTQPQIPE